MDSLCSYFPSPDVEPEHGWPEWLEEPRNRVKKDIFGQMILLYLDTPVDETNKEYRALLLEEIRQFAESAGIRPELFDLTFQAKEILRNIPR